MIQNSLFFFILLLASGAQAQGSAFHVTWDPVYELVDGSTVEEGAIAYRVYEATTGAIICTTDQTECIVPAQPGQCGTAYATAYLVESGLESAPSNSVSACIGDGEGDDPVVELDLVPAVPPVIEMTTTEGEPVPQWWERWRRGR